jgi:translation initiation factor 1
VRVSRETGGRNGKTVTVVRGLPLDAAALADIAKTLKAACGAGGSIKDGTIEIQGDHRDTVVSRLEQAGWRVKRAGG